MNLVLFAVLTIVRLYVWKSDHLLLGKVRKCFFFLFTTMYNNSLSVYNFAKPPLPNNNHYSTRRFSQDFACRLIPKRCRSRRRPLARCFLSLRSLCRSLRGFNWTWARMPTNNSSTLWSSPLDVSMNLQPQLLATFLPTATNNRLK